MVSLGWGGSGQEGPSSWRDRGTPAVFLGCCPWWSLHSIHPVIIQQAAHLHFMHSLGRGFPSKNVLSKKENMMRKLELSNVKYFAQGHPAGECQSGFESPQLVSENPDCTVSQKDTLSNSRALEMSPALPSTVRCGKHMPPVGTLKAPGLSRSGRKTKAGPGLELVASAR